MNTMTPKTKKVKENIPDKNKNCRDRFIKQALRGQPTKYEPEKHIPLLYDIMVEGKFMVDFCKEALISKTTFSLWRKSHPEFEEAYEVSRVLSESFWQRLPLHDKTINHAYWFVIMRNCFGLGKVKLKKPKDDSIQSKIEVILDAVMESGQLSFDELTKLSSLLSVAVKMQESTPTDPVMIERESREKLAETIENCERTIKQFEALKGLKNLRGRDKS